jgi:hypothetical protein
MTARRRQEWDPSHAHAQARLRRLIQKPPADPLLRQAFASFFPRRPRAVRRESSIGMAFCPYFISVDPWLNLSFQETGMGALRECSQMVVVVEMHKHYEYNLVHSCG